MAAMALILSTTWIVEAKQPDPLVQLGSAIFKDSHLSKNANQSCMTCHHPSAGFADPTNRTFPLLFPVSEGSIPDNFGGRNAPSAAYAGFSPIFHYDEDQGVYVGGAFWDGRATGMRLNDPLAEQALGPFLNPVEMSLADKEAVIDVIKKSSYASSFCKVFGKAAFDDVDTAYDNVGKAIAAFERSNEVNKFSSKFDKFWQEQNQDVSSFGVKGNGKYVGVPANFKSKYFNRIEAMGLALFNATNKGNCAACHVTENHVDSNGATYAPLFTDFTYDNLGIPKNQRIALLSGAQPTDYGLGARTAELMEVTPDILFKRLASGTPNGGKVLIAKDQAGKFKVPTLRNVGRSAPFGHNGYFVTLLHITHFYNTRDVKFANWAKPEVDLNVNKSELGNLGLSLAEEAAIVAFMETLTD
jgi:cytochrome c peroxidase